jgi:hypothetical protein
MSRTRRREKLIEKLHEPVAKDRRIALCALDDRPSIYVMADSNRRASEFCAWCRSLESNSVSDISPEQQHEVCWRSAKFMTPSVLAQTLIAGNADTATMWTFILGPVVILWIVGGIILATVRWVRRGF